MLSNKPERQVQLVASQCAPRAGYFDLWPQPDFGIGVIVLRAFTHMYASPLFMEGIVAVKPENQGSCLKYFRTHVFSERDASA
jgi:hypothetical protein